MWPVSLNVPLVMVMGRKSPSGSLSPVNTVLAEPPVRALATWFMASFLIEQADEKNRMVRASRHEEKTALFMFFLPSELGILYNNKPLLYAFSCRNLAVCQPLPPRGRRRDHLTPMMRTVRMIRECR